MATLVLPLAVTLVPPASASHSVGAGVYYAESYQATIPLRRGARARIYFTRYVGAGASAYVNTPPSPPSPFVAASPETYYACVSVYKRSDSKYFPSLYTCGEPEVTRFSMDPQMDRMRLQFDIVDDWYWYYADSDLPTTVNLSIRGRHPVRSDTPDASASTYGVSVSKWDTRQVLGDT